MGLGWRVSGPGPPGMLAAQPKCRPGQPTSGSHTQIHNQPRNTGLFVVLVSTDYGWATFISISFYLCASLRAHHFAREAPPTILSHCPCPDVLDFVISPGGLIFLFVSPASATWIKSCLLTLKCLLSRVFCSAVKHLLASGKQTDISLAVGLGEELGKGCVKLPWDPGVGEIVTGQPGGTWGKGVCLIIQFRMCESTSKMKYLPS